MKHATLYRRWRPRAFSQIVGQEPVVRTLGRAIETGRVSHAYLFSGPRGTGKTSTAKVLAMGLNCEEGPTPEPDGTCGSCRAIVNNSSMDVVEMDAASNRGIDEIRDLRDRVNLAPASGRVKVYIIDEVHMLTAEAFNALLKMLEEPPEHVIFVLATTEKHKVLPTIVSRCQSFDFRRPGIPIIAEKLREISTTEGIEAEPEALTVIAGAGDGSFRDAEGFLDQLSSFAEGRITAAMVRELLGSVGSGTLIETTAALYQRRAADALRIVDRLSNEGRDPGRFASELVTHLRNLMLLPHAPEVALAGVGAEERGPLEEQANAVSTAEVVRMVEALGDCLGRMKRGGDPRLDLELTFLKLARDYTEPSIESLLSRLERLEHTVGSGSVMSASSQEEPGGESASPAKTSDKESEDKGDGQASGREEPVEPDDGRYEAVDAGTLSAQWDGVMEELRRRRQALTATIFQEGRPIGFGDGVLEISFPEEPDFYVKEAKNSRHRDILGKLLRERFGIEPRLEMKVAGKEDPETRSTAENEPESPSGTEAGDAPPAEEAGSGAPGAAAGDGRIGSEQEAFEFVREYRGSSKPDGGS